MENRLARWLRHGGFGTVASGGKCYRIVLLSPKALKTALEGAYHWESATPGRVYLTQPMGGGQVVDFTWRETMDQARRMAAHLRSLDLEPGSHIALFSKNTAHWFMADLAVMMAGHVGIPLYPVLDAGTIRQILDHSESRLIFIGKLDGYDAMQDGIADEMPKIALPLAPPIDAPRWDEIVTATEPFAESPTRDPEELGTIIYTSGSTGVPKGVMLSFGAMATSAASIIEVLATTSEDRMLSYLPLAHVFERWIVETHSLLCGFRVFFAESLDTFANDLKRAQPTLFISVPRLWLKFQAGVFRKLPPVKLARLLKIPIVAGIVRRKVLSGLGLDQVRFAGSGSAPIPPELIQWYRDLGLELLEGYGMSENFACSHVSMPGRSRVGYVGNCYPGVEHRINDTGEIELKSPGNMMGYYKEPELTREAFTGDGFLKTGDRGEIDEQGRLRITGRIKEIFKTSKGKYVVPSPIENQLLTHAALEQICVSGSGLPQPYALGMLSEEAWAAIADPAKREEIETDLRRHLSDTNDSLVAYEKLQYLVVVKDTWTVENGFLTPTMKIKRAVIEEAYGPHAEAWHAANEPVVWQE